MRGLKLKDYNLADTVSAIATFPSRSALGIIKISGKKSFTIISKIFKPAKDKDIKKAKTYTLHYGWIIDKDKNPIDEVLVSIMRSPLSYTKEDVVEISSHGGPLVLNKILELVLASGARLALPGEFTYRALIRGRIDLLQAESILGIIDAKSDSSLALASSQLRGKASDKIKKLKGEVKDLFVNTESVINFPDSELDISFLNLGKKVDKIEKVLSGLIQGSDQARVMSEGLRCVICGRSNVGKSTLFNSLLREERVIVSKISGTTRDVVEETINIKGVPLKIYDTAGILEPRDLITRKALKKTHQTFDRADLVILVLDSSRLLHKDDLFLLDKIRDKNAILVLNKSDLSSKLELTKLLKIKAPRVRMCALDNTGLKSLENTVYNKVYNNHVPREDIIFLNHYQRQVLKKAHQNIVQVSKFLNQNHTIDLVNLELKECLNSLGKLSGEVFSEEILESIFSQFCIGK